MSSSTLNFTLVSSPKTKFSDAQILLREFTGKDFSRSEAENVWANIHKHKWNMSERLGRDVGLRVAAVDFIENFYHNNQGVTNKLKKKIKIPLFLQNAVRFYFETKGSLINY